jgi:hypothetical protein
MAGQRGQARWLEAQHPDAVLRALDGEVSERKLRLFACACCKRIPLLAEHPACQRALAVAERFTDGEVSRDDLRAAWAALPTGYLSPPLAWLTEAVTTAASLRFSPPHLAASQAAGHAARAWRDAVGMHDSAIESRIQVALLLDVIGHLFHDPVLALAWRDPAGAVGQLARAIYADGSFEELPVLADALEEAGCTDEQVLAHCRSAGHHARGCWVLDVLLGRS